MNQCERCERLEMKIEELKEEVIRASEDEHFLRQEVEKLTHERRLLRKHMHDVAVSLIKSKNSILSTLDLYYSIAAKPEFKEERW